MKISTEKGSFTPLQFAKLVSLNRRLNKLLGFETIAAKRDPRTGTFTGASTLTAAAVRKAWSGPRPNARGDAFKAALLAKLREPRA